MNKNEGVGDKYLKQKYQIDDFDEFNKKFNAMKLKEQDIIFRDGDWKLIKNPKSLTYFNESCRGVILLNGDLYLENFSDFRIHNNILEILYDKNILKGKLRKNWGRKTPQDSGFLTVQRFKNTNTIAIGESNRDMYDENDWNDLKHHYDEVLNKCKIKNPKIIFSNKLVGVKFNTLKTLSGTNRLTETVYKKNLVKFDFFLL